MKAVIDIGSNTTQLMLGELKNNKINILGQYIITTRLGSGTTKNLLTDRGINATVAAIMEYKEKISLFDVDGVRLIATSATRDAENRHQLLDAVKKSCGWSIDVLSGEEEAYLAYKGAMFACPKSDKVAVIDIGGGSTEIICGDKHSQSFLSMNIGAVRALEAGWDKDEIKSRIKNYINDFRYQFNSNMQAIGVGGTITSAAGIVQGLQKYDRSKIEGFLLEKKSVVSLLEQLTKLNRQQRCRFSPLLEKRGEIIVEGLWILESVMNLCGFENISVTGGGVLDGALAEMI